MIKVLPSTSILMDDLSRLSFGLEDLQTRHLQVITGTPMEVAVPRKVTLILFAMKKFEIQS